MPQGYYPEDFLPAGTPITFWCSGCNAEPATEEVEAEFNGRWVTVKIGQECLTKAQEAGKMEG